MEILKRKRWVKIVRYCFSVIKHQNPFFHLAKKQKIQIYNTSVFVRRSLWPFFEAFRKSKTVLRRSMTVDRPLFLFLFVHWHLIHINEMKLVVSFSTPSKYFEICLLILFFAIFFQFVKCFCSFLQFFLRDINQYI